MKQTAKERMVNEALADNFNLRASIVRARGYGFPFFFVLGVVACAVGTYLFANAF